jgi:hypothetical protein
LFKQIYVIIIILIFLLIINEFFISILFFIDIVFIVRLIYFLISFNFIISFLCKIVGFIIILFYGFIIIRLGLLFDFCPLTHLRRYVIAFMLWHRCSRYLMVLFICLFCLCGLGLMEFLPGKYTLYQILICQNSSTILDDLFEYFNHLHMYTNWLVNQILL